MATGETIDLAPSQRTSILLDLDIEELINVLSKKQTKRCESHTEQYLYFYCKKCHVPVCRDCTVVQHRDLDGHRVGELKELVKEYSTKFTKQQEVAETDTKSLENSRNKLLQKKSELNSMKVRLEKEIENDLQRNINVLQQRAKLLRQRVSNYCDTKNELFQNKLHEISEVKDQIDAQVADFERAKNDNDTIETFQKYRELKAANKTRKTNIASNVTFRKLRIVYDDEDTCQRLLQNRGKV